MWKLLTPLTHELLTKDGAAAAAGGQSHYQDRAAQLHCWWIIDAHRINSYIGI